MTTTLTRPTNVDHARTPSVRSSAYTVLMSLTTVAILLQGLWAGIFLQPDSAGSNGWIEVHARGGEVALVLAAAAAVVGFMRVRVRRDLWIGAIVVAALLAVEAYIGGLVHDAGKQALTAVHVPLAMAIICVAVWLTARSRQTSTHRVPE